MALAGGKELLKADEPVRLASSLLTLRSQGMSSGNCVIFLLVCPAPGGTFSRTADSRVRRKKSHPSAMHSSRGNHREQHSERNTRYQSQHTADKDLQQENQQAEICVSEPFGTA